MLKDFCMKFETQNSFNLNIVPKNVNNTSNFLAAL